MEKQEIIDLIEKGLTITDLIDVVIEYNGIIGVGLVTLSEGLEMYVLDKIQPFKD